LIRNGFGFDIHPHVTISAVLVLAAFIFLSLRFKGQAAAISDTALASISVTFGWFFILATNVFSGR